MRTVGPGSSRSVLFWLLGTLVGMFVLQQLGRVFIPQLAVTQWFALTPDALASGHIWTLLTYSVLHDTRGIWHLLGNALGLFFIGRIVEPTIGSRRFLLLFVISALVGAVAWLGVNFNRGGALIGASAAVFGLLIYFCCQRPNERITLLLFFIIPVNVVPKYLAMVLAGFQLFFFFFGELPTHPAINTGIAHSAHLGGMLAGLVLYRIWEGNPRAVVGSSSMELPKWMKSKKSNPEIGGVYRVNVSKPRDMKHEVDRILDKINNSGFGSLTPEEKRTLDEARDTLGKR